MELELELEQVLGRVLPASPAHAWRCLRSILLH